MAESPTAPAVRFNCAVPILRVGSLQAGIEYYVGTLGFEVDWQDPGIMGSVSRGGVSLMLCQGDQTSPGAWVWIAVEDADRLFEEYAARGAAIRVPPTNYPWAREMQVLDPDGNVLRFGSDTDGKGPFGRWLDGRGGVWEKRDDGRWHRVE